MSNVNNFISYFFPSKTITVFQRLEFISFLSCFELLIYKNGTPKECTKQKKRTNGLIMSMDCYFSARYCRRPLDMD